MYQAPPKAGTVRWTMRGTAQLPVEPSLLRGASGMAQNFDASSTQGVIMVNVGSASAGSIVTLSDSTGKELLSWQAPKAFSSVVLSCPGIIQGETYSLAVDGSITQS